MINPYINYPLDNSRKVAPVATSVAPVVAGHCTPMFVLIKSHICPHATAHIASMTTLTMYYSLPIYGWLLRWDLLKRLSPFQKYIRWKFELIMERIPFTKYVYAASSAK